MLDQLKMKKRHMLTKERIVQIVQKVQNQFQQKEKTVQSDQPQDQLKRKVQKDKEQSIHQ